MGAEVQGAPGSPAPRGGGPRPAVLASSAPSSRGFGARLLAQAPPAAVPAPARAGRPAVAGTALSIPFRLASADGLTTDFTNYVRGYKGALDYVWCAPCASAVACLKRLPRPA